MKGSVLYISYDGLTDPLGQSQVIPYLEGLSKLNYRITIISAEKRNKYGANKNYIDSILKKSNISWDPIFYTKRPPIISTVLDIYKIKRKAKSIYNKEPFDIVHCRSYISAFIGLFLKSKFEVKFIFDMRGFFADERIDGGLWNLNNPIFKWVYHFFKRKEKTFLNNADSVVSLTEEGKKIIYNWKINPYDELNIEVIPCCVDNKLFAPSSADKFLKDSLKKGLRIRESDFILSYLGSIGTWYMLPEMLDFFKELKSARPNAKFLFITKENPDVIYNIATAKGLDKRSIIIAEAKREEVPLYLSISQISIFFIKPVFSKQASSPTKLAELMSMGIPIICNDNVGDINKIFAETNFGSLVSAFATDEYQRIIKEIDNIIAIPKENIIKSSKQFFSLQIGIEKYDSIYQSLLD